MAHFIKATSPAAPITLSIIEGRYLRDLKRGGDGAGIPCETRMRFFAHACVKPMERGIGLTPRGRTALLLGRL